MAERRVVPGIYVTEQQYALNPLRIDTGVITGFVGIAERGPLHTPVRITSFDEYLKTFGSFDTAGNLPLSVYSYFKCGGSECIIVRTANEKHVKKAKIKIQCGSGQVIFEALSEGTWGNKINAKIWHEGDLCKKVLALDNIEGTWISIDDENINEHDVLRLSLFGQTIFRIIERKDGNKCFLLNPPKLFKQVKDLSQDIKVEKAFVSISFTYKGKSEHFLHLSMNPASERYFISHINERSQLFKIISNNANGTLRSVFSVHASGGSDGIAEMSAGDFIGYYNGANDYRGLGALESRDDISLIALPDISWLLSLAGKPMEEREKNVYAIQAAMINQAERFRGRFAILDVPENFNNENILEWAKKFDSHSAAAYYPSIDVLDPTDQSGSRTIKIPPSGAICGCITASDNEKGIFHAPANYLLHGAVNLSEKIDDASYELLYPAGINLLKYFPGRGIKIWGARTLSSDPDWKYINVRRTFSAICKSLKTGTQWAVFEPNEHNLRKRLVRQVSGFLLDLWRKGYLAGSTAEQSFYVRCDEELNPPEQIDQGILRFETGIAISKPAEFFNIFITAEKEGANVYVEEEK
jgi:phage tail sheath protein FI